MMKKILAMLLTLVVCVEMSTLDASADSAVHSHPICGASCSHSGSDAHGGIVWEAADSLPTAAGNYYLTADITTDYWSRNFDVNGTVNLCLNGKTIYANSYALGVKAGTTLNICDCSADGEGTVTSSEQSKVFNNYGTINLYSGAISYTATSSQTAAIDNNSGASLNMYGGKIESSYMAVRSRGSIENIQGGIISATHEVLSIDNNSDVTISGTAVINTTSSYATISLYNGDLTISGGTVKNTGSSTALQMPHGSGTFSMTGGSISSNGKQTVHAVSTSRDIKISGGSITNEYPSVSYGSSRAGWALDGHSFKSLTLSGAPAIESLYLSTGYSVTIGEGGLNNASPIGVYCQSDPAPVTGQNSTDYSGRFTARDNTYAVYNDDHTVMIGQLHEVIINPADNGTVTAGNAKAATGQTVALTISPAEGYKLNAIECTYRYNDNAKVTLSELDKDGKCTFTMPDTDVKISVSFIHEYPQVTFNANGGTGTMKPVSVMAADGTYTLPALCGFDAPANMTFGGWSTQKGGSAISDFTIHITEDTELFAVWTYTGSHALTTEWRGLYNVSHSPTVDIGALLPGDAKLESGITFEAGAGSPILSSLSPTVATGTANASLNFTTRVLTAPASDQIVMKINTSNYGEFTITIEVTLHGYKVSFDANGGTGTMDDAEAMGEYELPANGFTAPYGKQFKAWSVNGVEHQPGDTISITDAVSITVVWEEIPGFTPEAPKKANLPQTGDPIYLWLALCMLGMAGMLFLRKKSCGR